MEKGRILELDYEPLDNWVEVMFGVGVYFEIVDLEPNKHLNTSKPVATFAAISIRMTPEYVKWIMNIGETYKTITYIRCSNDRVCIGTYSDTEHYKVRTVARNAIHHIIKYRHYEMVYNQLVLGIKALGSAIALEMLDDETN